MNVVVSWKLIRYEVFKKVVLFLLLGVKDD